MQNTGLRHGMKHHHHHRRRRRRGCVRNKFLHYLSGPVDCCCCVAHISFFFKCTVKRGIFEQMLKILKVSRWCTPVHPKSPKSRLITLDHLRRPRIIQDHPRPPHITTDHPEPLQINPYHTRSPRITSDHPVSLQTTCITPDHPNTLYHTKSPRITPHHPVSPQITKGTTPYLPISPRVNPDHSGQ